MEAATEALAVKTVAMTSEQPREVPEPEPTEAPVAQGAKERVPRRVGAAEEERLAFRQKVEEILPWASRQMFAGEFFGLFELSSMDNTLGRIETLMLEFAPCMLKARVELSVLARRAGDAEARLSDAEAR
ncbi:uncharacterized protein LOC131256911 [Magnolia sinica]|uniref:uncharacterized protein LOC131256911 n=1 Tax=Magnolia sinica TaxID=86752 RepID=UPI00265A4542|nr:uncharacterized protein LOC131256911 [Magnolia sinica]